MQPLEGPHISALKRPETPWPRVAHVITGLSTGGAEMMLYKLLHTVPDAPERAFVISLTGDGPIGQAIRSLGVQVRVLNLSARRPNPLAVMRLAQWIKEGRPDLVQTWMYHADVIGGLAAKLADRKVPVLWNVRASNLDPAVIGLSARVFARLAASLSGIVPAQILSCSTAAAELCVKAGYPRSRLCVVPNGFDLERFRPDPVARNELRSELEVDHEEVLIGSIARFDPIKDHATFVRAASRLFAQTPKVRFLLCGAGVTWDNTQLSDWIDQAELRSRFFLLGERSDVHRIDAALDIATVSSRAAEGFPNVLGEAMACGVPCVATNVGDAAYIIGDTGLVVPPGDEAAIARAWQELIDLGPKGRQERGRRTLERVAANFSLPAVAKRYKAIYESAATRVAV